MGSGQVTHMLGMTLVRVTITGINWHTSDVECNGTLSCGCGMNDKDSQASNCDCPVQTRKIRVILKDLSESYVYLYVQSIVYRICIILL